MLRIEVQGGPTLQDEKKPAFQWTDRHSPYATDNPRAKAEDELLSLRPTSVVLNLSVTALIAAIA